MAGRGHVYVIDDHPMVRSAVVALLEAADYRAFGFESAERFLLDGDIRRPAVVVTDMRMPSMTGLELVRRIAPRDDGPPIIVMSGESAPQEIIDALKGGALDFLLKPVSNRQLLAAIDSALELDGAHVARRAALARIEAVAAALTARERSVLAMIRRGHGNKIIAQALCIRPDTVKKHRAHIYAKFGVSDLAALLALDPDLPAILEPEPAPGEPVRRL